MKNSRKLAITQKDFFSKEDLNSKECLAERQSTKCKRYALIDFISSITITNIKTGECEVIAVRR